MVDRHTVAEHSRDELGIVPILWVEFLAQSLNGSLVAALVLELEVVAAGAVITDMLDNLTLGNALGKHDALVVVL